MACNVIGVNLVKHVYRRVLAAGDWRKFGAGLVVVGIMFSAVDVAVGDEMVNSFSPNNICGGEPLDHDRVIEKVGFPAREVVFLGETALHYRVRSCYKLTGCEPWSYDDDSILGAILTSRAGPVSREATVYLAVHANQPEVRLVVGPRSQGRQYFASLPDPDGIEIKSEVLRVAGQPFRGNFEVYESCAKLVARAVVDAPTPRDNSRHYEVELGGIFRY